jgi:hypothetical protein
VTLENLARRRRRRSFICDLKAELSSLVLPFGLVKSFAFDDESKR